MNVQTLLEHASQCHTNGNARQLLDLMQKALTGEGVPLGCLPIYNPNWTTEDDGPFVQLEFIQEISAYYATSIQPQLRGGVFSMRVNSHQLRDGLGVQSQRYELVDGFEEEEIEGAPGQTLADLARCAADYAADDHALLMERTGVPEPFAFEFDATSWAALCSRTGTGRQHTGRW